MQHKRISKLKGNSKHGRPGIFKSSRAYRGGRSGICRTADLKTSMCVLARLRVETPFFAAKRCEVTASTCLQISWVPRRRAGSTAKDPIRRGMPTNYPTGRVFDVVYMSALCLRAADGSVGMLRYAKRWTHRDGNWTPPDTPDRCQLSGKYLPPHRAPPVQGLVLRSCRAFGDRVLTANERVWLNMALIPTAEGGRVFRTISAVRDGL